MPDPEMGLGEAANTLREFSRIFRACARLEQACQAALGADQHKRAMETEVSRLQGESDFVTAELAQRRGDLESVKTQHRDTTAAIATAKRDLAEERNTANREISLLRDAIAGARRDHDDALGGMLVERDAVQAELAAAKQRLADFYARVSHLSGGVGSGGGEPHP